MVFKNLRVFIEELKKRNDIVIIDTLVDPYLEIAEIHRRVIAANGPALLFTNVKGKKFPVATNLFGTHDRIMLAFGNEPYKFIQQAAALPHELMPPSLKKIWGLRDFVKKGLRIGFKQASNAPVLKNKIPDSDLTQLPALTGWIEDGGPFLTLPLVHTQGGGKKPDNLGMYRVQIFEANEAGMHFQIGKGAGFHLFEAEEKNEPLAANIYLGGPPALVLSAIAPLPENVPELLLTSLLLGDKLQKGKIENFPLDPIAEAEFCISGYIPPKVRRPEGPFGDHYGYYSLIHDFPVIRPQNIYHRDNAIFPATVVGKPRQEDFYIGDYLQELLSPLFPVVMPAVRDLWSYGETGYHALSAAVFHERYEKECMASAFRILGEGQLSLTKFLLGIDKPINLKDFKSVLTYILERVDWEKNLFIFPNLSMDTLDYAGPEINKGSKGVLFGIGEAKRQLPKELQKRPQSDKIRKIKVYCPGCLVVEIPNYADDKEFVSQLPQLPEFKDWQFIVAVDDCDKASKTDASFLWTTFTRFEPASDIYANKTTLSRNTITYQGPITIDARMKPWYPKELFCDDKTRQTVSERWNEYFPNRNVEMGSSDEGHLFS